MILIANFILLASISMNFNNIPVNNNYNLEQNEIIEIEPKIKENIKGNVSVETPFITVYFLKFNLSSANIVISWEIENPLREVNTQRPFINILLYESVSGEFGVYYPTHAYYTLDYDGFEEINYTAEKWYYWYYLEVAIGYYYSVREPMSFIFDIEIFEL